MDFILKNARIPQGDRAVPMDVLVDKGVIRGFVSSSEGIPAGQVVDVKGNLVVPGCIDPHTHFNDPGFSHRENFQTGTESAAVGGLTTIVDMPCTSKPSVRSADQFQVKYDAVSPKALIDYSFWGGMTGEDVREGWMDNIYGQIERGIVSFKLYMTPSVPTYPKVSDAEMLELMYKIAPTGIPIGIHSENFDICDFYTKKLRKLGRMDGPAWAEARKPVAEKAAIQLIVAFAEETGARVHIVHMSSGAGAQIVREAKKRGVQITSETCPHYLILTAQEAMTKFGSFAKIAPPLRSAKDIVQLWEGLIDGAVDFMGTDHAPYEISTEKAAEGMDIWTSMPGIPGVETMVPFMVSEGLNKGRLSLSRFVDVMSRNAAIHYGLYPKKGVIEVGSDADFTVIDLEREWTIDQEQMHSKAKYTPLHGLKLKGKPVMTIVRGEVVYDEEHGVVGRAGFGQFVPRQQISQLPRVLKY